MLTEGQIDKSFSRLRFQDHRLVASSGRELRNREAMNSLMLCLMLTSSELRDTTTFCWVKNAHVFRGE